MIRPKLIFLISLFALLLPLILSAQTLEWIVAADNGGYVHSLSYNPPNSPSEIWKRQVPSAGICGLTITDLDADGSKEILVFSLDGIIYCLQGNTGNEIWRYSSPYADFERYRGVYTEDTDGDQKLEVITSIKVNSPGNEYYPGAGGGLIVLEDDGTEKMRYDSPVVSGWNGNGPDEVAMADFNGDGIKDFVFMVGGCLYSAEQPLIQVIDLSGSSPSLLRDFRHTYTLSGMNDLKVSDVDNDSDTDFMAGGWRCPTAAFDSYGSLIWERDFSGGSADRYLLFTDDLDSLGQPALLVGTASYSYEANMYIHVVDPSNGTDLYSAITYPLSARQFTPQADRVADIDGDGENEILGWFQSADLSSDLLISASALDGSVEWAIQGTWNQFSTQLKDADSNGIYEVYIGEGNLLTCLQGDGTTVWQYDLGNPCYYFDLDLRITPTHDLTITAGQGGTTDPAPGTYTYDYCTSVIVSATSDTCYVFDSWTGDVSTDDEHDNPLTIHMDSDKSIQANFTPQQYTLTLSADTGGTTEPAPGIYTYDCGTQVDITAVIENGYRFNGWSGDIPPGREYAKLLKFTMDSDKEVQANFIAESDEEDGDNKPFWDNLCFIATAAYGSPLHPHVQVLRDFRDKCLMPYKPGRILVKLYYRLSPPIAKIISKHTVFRTAVRISIYPLVGFSYLMIRFGAVSTSVLFVFIFALSISAVSFWLKKHQENQENHKYQGSDCPR